MNSDGFENLFLDGSESPFKSAYFLFEFSGNLFKNIAVDFSIRKTFFNFIEFVLKLAEFLLTCNPRFLFGLSEIFIVIRI